MESPSNATVKPPLQAAWPVILCLIGLDYFSTLGYQPSIAYDAAGRLAPVATILVVLVTLCLALPVYCYLAGRSPHGQGVIGLLEKLLPGWRGKLLILLLLGFAASDFVFTKTLSAADAAVHLINNPNPHWQHSLAWLSDFKETLTITDDGTSVWHRVTRFWDRQLVVTLLLLISGFGFFWIVRKGFTRGMLRLAVIVVVAYLALNALIIAGGVRYLLAHTDILEKHFAETQWQMAADPMPTSWSGILLLCVLVFPKLALGLSGFELSMVVMPMVRGKKDDDPHGPRGRVRNTRKMLCAAAGIMSIYLLGSIWVTSSLIPADAFGPHGRAKDRALAYLAHGGLMVDGETADAILPFAGQSFGTLYDLSTILILLLAGASVTIGLRDWVPQYLHRLGMELEWAHRLHVIIHLFNVIKLVITLLFHASVTAQRGAYATSVLVMMASAALVVAVDCRRRAGGSRGPLALFVLAGLVFLGTGLALVVSRPEGIAIAGCFIVAILITSMASRAIRTGELRFGGFRFKDDSSRFLWDSLVFLEFPVLVPHRPGRRGLVDKEREIRISHRLPPDMPVVFVEAELDDPSDFVHLPMVEVCQEEGRFIVRVTGGVSISHVLAAVSLELSKVGKPPEIHFGWSEESPLAANVNFVLFGQGNVPWMVRDLIRRAEAVEERRPKVVIG